MLKTFGTLIATSLVLVPAAAGFERFEVDIAYNGDLLATEEGTATVLASVEEQAEAACTVTLPYTGTSTVDEDCVADVTAKAIAKIAEVEGRELPTDFAGLDPVILSAGQR